jgi:hypothetical protein
MDKQDLEKLIRFLEKILKMTIDLEIAVLIIIN